MPGLPKTPGAETMDVDADGDPSYGCCLGEFLVGLRLLARVGAGDDAVDCAKGRRLL
jgi:hypothetical protein